MKRLKITVDGKSYEVEVEELGASAPAALTSPTPAAAPAPRPAAAPLFSREKTVGAPAGVVSAPMPGTVLELKVKKGDQVSAGDVLLILEAMKMENEIPSPRDGTVSSVSVAKGASVNSGDPLVTIE